MFEDRFSDPASQTSLSTGNVGIDVAGVTLGATHPYATALTERRYQLVDNFSMTVLGHSLKLGFDVSQTRDSINELANSNGTLLLFVADGLCARPDHRQFEELLVFHADAWAIPSGRCACREIHVYVQDTWKATRNLTLSGGLYLGKNENVATHGAATNTALLQYGHHSVAHPESDSACQPGLSDEPPHGVSRQLRLVLRSLYGPDLWMRCFSAMAYTRPASR